MPVITTHKDNLYDKATNGYVLECSYDTISLEDVSAKAYPKLNDALKALSELTLKAQEETVNVVKNDADMRKLVTKDLHFSDEGTIQICRIDEDVFSFFFIAASYLGGAHPNGGIFYSTYDTKTGEEIQLADVVKSKKDLIARVKAKLKESFPDAGFYDLDKSMKDYEEGNSELNWILTPAGITVSFNPDDIAPYAAGVLPVAIRFDEDRELFTGKYKESTGGFVLPVFEAGTTIMDMDGSGKPSVVKVQCDYEEGNEHYTGLTVSCNNKSYKLDDNIFISYYAKVVHTKDNRNYVYVFTTGYSDCEELLVFDLKDGNVNYCGAVEAGEPGKMTADENGEGAAAGNDTESKMTIEKYPITDPDHIALQSRVDAMSTYHIRQYYKIGDKGLPEAIGEFGDAVETITLTAKADIPGKSVDIAKNELKDDVTVKKGDKITIYRTNGKDTVIFKTDDGKYVALKYESGSQINGKPLEDLFENLFFAG